MTSTVTPTPLSEKGAHGFQHHLVHRSQKNIAHLTARATMQGILISVGREPRSSEFCCPNMLEGRSTCLVRARWTTASCLQRETSATRSARAATEWTPPTPSWSCRWASSSITTSPTLQTMEFSAAVETERSQRRLMKKSAVQFGSEEMTPFGRERRLV